MSKIDELINELCPNGVEYKKVGDIFNVITDYTAAGSFADIARNVKYIKNADYAQLIRTTDIKSKFVDKNSFVYVDENAFKYLWRVNIDEECIVMPNVGNCGEVYFIKPEDLPNKNNVLGPNAILMKSKNNNLKFLYYCIDTLSFKRKLAKITSTTGQTKFNKTNLRELILPVPPIEVQREIVRILDNFTELTAELTAELTEELTARRKQYEFYLNHILNGIEEYEIRDLENCCIILDNKRKPVTKALRTSGEYPYYGANGILDYVSEYIFDGVFILVGEDGSVITKNNTPVVTWAEGKIWVNNHAHIIKELDDESVDLRYLYYYLQTINVRELIHGNIPKLNQGDFRKLQIKVPKIETQKEIVNILIKLDKLCNDISEGLPAEIEARQKQYEYYRDKLLTFKELV